MQQLCKVVGLPATLRELLAGWYYTAHGQVLKQCSPSYKQAGFGQVSRAVELPSSHGSRSYRACSLLLAANTLAQRDWGPTFLYCLYDVTLGETSGERIGCPA